jgi:hypothetical protein
MSQQLILGWFQVMYDRATEFWRLLWTIFSEYDLLNEQGLRGWLLFYSTQQRFFRQMLMAAKACAPSCHLLPIHLPCSFSLARLPPCPSPSTLAAALPGSLMEECS